MIERVIMPVVVISWFAIAGCSTSPSCSGPELKKVDDIQNLPGLADRMDKQFGNDFVLDHLPAGARTMEAGFTHFMSKESSDLVRKEVGRARTVFGGELRVRRRDETLIFFVYSADPGFTDLIAYSVTASTGHHWGVYLFPRRKGP